MKLALAFLITFGIATPVLAKPPAGHRNCSFKCKSIPPMTESLLEFGNSSVSALPSKNLSVLVWNLYKGREKPFRREILRLSKGKNLLMLQEVALDEIFQPVNDEFDNIYNHVMAVSFLMKDAEATGVSNLSQAPYSDAEHKRTSELEPFSNSPKMNLATVYPIENTSIELLVINIHGINFRGTDALLDQLNLEKEIMSQHTGPILFAGDFNTKNKERLRVTDQFMSNFGLNRVNFSNDKRKKPLDHFYSRGVVIQEANLLTGNPGSDHPAITVRFDISNP